MLTGNLLRFTRRQGRVRPTLIDPGAGKLTACAGELLSLMEAHRGRRRGELEAVLKGFAPAGVPAKVADGLARLALDRCTFEVAEGTDPPALREALFDAGAEGWRSGKAREPGWRAAVAARVGRQRGLAPEEVDAALFADLEENQRLAEFRPLDPRGLLLRYNVAQVQGLLLQAERVEVESPHPAPQRLRQLFRYLKFYGLLFAEEAPRSASSTSGGSADISARIPALRLLVDGPLSLLESRTRYGLSLAQFFPALLLWREPWTLTARLPAPGGRSGQGTGRGSGASLVLELAPHPWLQSHYPDQGQWVPAEVRHFVDTFNARYGEAGEAGGGKQGKAGKQGKVGKAGKVGRKAGGWRAEPAHAILPLPGNRSLIPDFAFRHAPSGRTAYLESFPYPAADRVAARLEQIRAAGRDDYLLACRGTPAVKALEAEHPALLAFRRSLLPASVLEALEALEKLPA